MKKSERNMVSINDVEVHVNTCLFRQVFSMKTKTDLTMQFDTQK